MYLQLSTLWQDWNQQYYQGHRHLWTPTPATLTIGTPIESTPKGVKRGLPHDTRPLSSFKRRQAFSISETRDPLHIDGFQYNAQYKILICISCESALQTSPSAWYWHLNSTHRILGPACKTLMERFRTYDLYPAKDIVAPLCRVLVVQGLRILSGFCCRICPPHNRAFMTTC
jgi:hypothetical protein